MLRRLGLIFESGVKGENVHILKHDLLMFLFC